MSRLLIAASLVSAATAIPAHGSSDQSDLEPDTATSHTLGLKWVSPDGRFAINPWLRAQVRYSDPFDDDPRTAPDFDDLPGADLDVRRARLKVEGHLFDPKIGFYYEHELSGDRPLLDLRLDIDLGGDLLLRAGQYKVLYNRERIDSSGKQQLIERSIATYAFTLDRQQGVTLAKRWAAGTSRDNWLMLGVFDGDGRDPAPRGDDPLLVARWQWQFLGEALPFSQGDYQFRPDPAATLAFGYARVTSPYTRYSSSGGGQLSGFEAGGDDRYRMVQWLQEFAWQHDGYSFQQEYHIKRIDDTEGDANATLRGGYAQIGKAWLSALTGRPVEMALRYAQVEWDTSNARDQKEWTLAANLYIAGHNNKISLDLSRLQLRTDAGSEHDTRVRLQWDISF